jgi:predicted nucleic acid-binding protein
MKCLDTTYLIDSIRDPDSIIDFTRKLEKKETLATTTYNVFEVYFGAHAVKSASAKNKIVDKLGRFLEPIQIIPFDLSDAIRAAEIGGTLKKKGKIVGADAITAAIALNSGCNSVVSRNRTHFKEIEKVTGLKLVEY